MSINVKSFLKMIVEANVVFISIDVIYILSKLRFSTNRVYFSFKFCLILKFVKFIY